MAPPVSPFPELVCEGRPGFSPLFLEKEKKESLVFTLAFAPLARGLSLHEYSKADEIITAAAAEPIKP